MKILLTGASGFLGRALGLRLLSLGYTDVVPVVHRTAAPPEFATSALVSPGLSSNVNWGPALDGVDVVIHCGARAHMRREPLQFALTEFRRVNVEGTVHLARQASDAGVRRFIFISSIGVNGQQTDTSPFTPDDEPAPYSPYSQSKHEAEEGLRSIAEKTGIEVVIIRPPMVYGPNAPGNFGLLIRWLHRGAPLPLGAVTDNRRSLVGLDNLVDLIVTCVEHPRAANQTFLVSDGADLSTADFLRRIGKSSGRRVNLLPIPVKILKTTLGILGEASLARSVLCSLQVDISKTCGFLNWRPPVSIDEGLRKVLNRS